MCTYYFVLISSVQDHKCRLCPFLVVQTNLQNNYCIFSIAKCIDHYTKQCVENADLPEGEKKPIDQRLEGIVNKMFQRCLDDHKYKQAIGIALETRRLDVFEKTILESVSRLCHFRGWD